MKKKKTKSERITIRIDARTFKILKDLAKKEDVSVGFLIRRAVNGTVLSR